ncbi:hypothetical protein PAHAL_4G129000 [Panicum hallii]|jgi:hypothetical protein|uniref:Uncharacterized protein n=1 Tax=Panicum hallii TaxID=206008 RepID=A0A2T8JCS1_9POAL|nr:hypothetical protein PAHAL_4G129000 [Panicum hallii]
MHELERSRSRFKEYSPTGPRDGHRGPRGQCRPEQILKQRLEAETEVEADPMAAGAKALAAAEAEALAATEARLPAYLAADSDDSEDDEDFTPTIPVQRAAHNHEAGPSRVEVVTERHDLSPPPPPPITAAQVTVPDTLASILQTLIEQQCHSDER